VLLQLGQYEGALGEVVLGRGGLQGRRFSHLLRLVLEKLVDLLDADAFGAAVDVFGVIDVAGDPAEVLRLRGAGSTSSGPSLTAEVMTTPFLMFLCSMSA
jgi:hypothetical protein